MAEWSGFSGTGGRTVHLPEGSKPDAVIVRWPGKVPAGKVSNELVHGVEFLTTLVTAAGGTVQADRQIDGMDMADFLLGGAGESGRGAVFAFRAVGCGVKWHQWKLHLFKQERTVIDLEHRTSSPHHNLK